MINIGLKTSRYLCCQSLYHSLSLAVIRCTTRCHSLSLFVPLVVTHCTTRCHSLSLFVPLVVTHCTTRCHSLSLVVPLAVTRCHLLSLVVPLVCLFINDRSWRLFIKKNTSTQLFLRILRNTDTTKRLQMHRWNRWK